MNPLTFPCPRCAKRLGVGLELAGKSVRCPHCREVVVAPGAATAPEPDLLMTPGPRESAESIFADPEESDDSLFAAPPHRVLTLPPPEPQPAAPTRLPNPLITPPTDANPFDIAHAPPPKRLPPERKPLPWKSIAVYALIGYAVLMTLLAVWGWMRTVK